MEVICTKQTSVWTIRSLPFQLFPQAAKADVYFDVLTGEHAEDEREQ